MAELIREVLNPVEDRTGAYVASIYGDPGPGDEWIGWIVFHPVRGGPPLRTERETTQPNLEDLRYWASGLTYAYLEGALDRARKRLMDHHDAAVEAARPLAGFVPLSIETIDDRLPRRLFGGSAEPGRRRSIDGGAVLLRSVAPAGPSGASVYDLVLEVGSRTAAAVAANWLYSRLNREPALLRIRGRVVETRNDRIRDAILQSLKFEG